MCFSLTTELVAWFVVYRHDEYKKSVAEVVELQERVAQMEEKMQFSVGTQSLSQ